MTAAELDLLVAQIGDEILARMKDRPGAVCPSCRRELRPRPAPLSEPAMALGRQSIAKLIDHTLLKPDAQQADIERLCAEAAQYGFFSVCVNSTWVPLAALLLSKTQVKVCTVVGFPLGASVTEAKLAEAETALRCGAHEIDVVQNVGALRSGETWRVRAEAEALARMAHAGGALLKVILETSLLDDTAKVLACQLARDAGADFVKTSTGFSGGGATVEDVALMRATVGPGMGVKASGGIRTLEDVERMVAAGATRIGASAGVAIVQGADPSPGAGGY